MLTRGIPPAFRDGVPIYIYCPPLSGQSRVSRATKLRTDGVHSPESTGTGPEVSTITGAAFSGSTMDDLSFPTLTTHTRLNNVGDDNGTESYHAPKRFNPRT